MSASAPTRLTKPRLAATISLLERGIEDLVYDYRENGGVDIKVDDASLRAQIYDALEDRESVGIFEPEDVWAAKQVYQDATAALTILSNRLHKPPKSDAT